MHIFKLLIVTFLFIMSNAFALEQTSSLDSEQLNKAYIDIQVLQEHMETVENNQKEHATNIKDSTELNKKNTETLTKLNDSKNNLNYIWIVIAAVLVFFMQAGFAFLESGASRSKNMVNVLMKNYMDMVVGAFAFVAVGFAFMFGINKTGWIGNSHFMLANFKPDDYVFFFFQMMFAATAATIVSGAIAERAKFATYLVGSFVISAIIYPIYGSWAWGSFYEGQGWLKQMGFIDFAGSTVVHTVGAWCALIATILIGPRIGRFGRNGKIFDIPGHNIALSALGTFILWFAWFGFNGGSTLIGDASIGLIVTNTHLGGCAGALAVMALQFFRKEKILMSMVLNGGITGLVAVTAGAATMSIEYASLTGAIGGILMYSMAKLLLLLRIDDVVGAFPVHGAGGIWGTLAAGIFYSPNMFDPHVIYVQLIGIASCAAWTIVAALILYGTLKLIYGIRVSAEDERIGLDYTEHAELGYPEFQKDVMFNQDEQSKS